MPCFKPLNAWRSSQVNPATGKRGITFNPKQRWIPFPWVPLPWVPHDKVALKLPCGQCIGCRLERSRQWAVRCSHEASLYQSNSFITLTYSDPNLPLSPDSNLPTLYLPHFQTFMKDLRNYFCSNSRRWRRYRAKHGLPRTPFIRYFHCGEYGERFGRPHYHACLFNFQFPDLTLWKYSRPSGFSTSNPVPYYTSDILSRLWPHGFSTIGEVNFESAAYVARYVTKKITGPKALSHYGGHLDAVSGKPVYDRKPEYTTMSRRPGLGKGWYEKFKDDVFPLDQVVMRGKIFKPPKFYDRLYELEYPTDYAMLKFNRAAIAELNQADSTPARLRIREFLKQGQAAKLIRGYEKNET